MKINIGPYLNWFGPYQLAGLLKFVGLSKKTCDKIAEWIPAGPFQLIYKLRKRTIKIHIDPYDIWSMDQTLAYIITPMLKMLKERKVGIPGRLCYDDEGNEIEFDLAIKEWNSILDKMIWSFEQKINNDDWEDQFFKNGSYDSEGHKAYSNKIQEGIDLFAKHYNSLWD